MVETVYRLFNSQLIVVIHLRLDSLKISYELGATAVAQVNMERLTERAQLLDMPFNFPYSDVDELTQAVENFGRKMDERVQPMVE